jgi:glycosyltransferase involved in cell wall biosynthesis
VHPDPSIGAERGAVVVVIDGREGSADIERCLDSVIAHTGNEVPLVALGDFRSDGAAPRRERLVRASPSKRPLDAALALAAPADVVYLSAGCVLTPGWLAGLRDAAYSDSRVASATPLTFGGGEWSLGLPVESSLEAAAAAVRRGSLRVRPRIRAAGGPCVYMRRDALELVEPVDGLGGFSIACLERGLCHVLADDVLIGGGGPRSPPGPAGHDEPVARSLGAARRGVRGLSLAFDARGLTGPMNGTKIQALELIGAVARASEQPVRALISPDLDSETRALLEEVALVEAVTPGHAIPVDAASPRADLIHRPFQVDSPADLGFLAQVADRTVITQQDLIGYSNPAYFASPADWERYRALTRSATVVADHVLFFSEHVRDEALAEDLVEPHRASVVHIGVDHRVITSLGIHVRHPAGGERLPADAEVMACIGADYVHKNRVFALRVLAELKHRHGWGGALVFAGSHVPWGGSRAQESRLLEGEPALRQSALDLGPISEAEKEWLLERATVVIYPTVSEGFGLVPFEAAKRGVPCLWARGTSLEEILPDSAAGIVPWDATASAERALALMRDDEARAENIAAIRRAAGGLRWGKTAERLLEVYRATCDAPPATIGVFERGAGLMREGLSEDAIRLVGPGGALPRELERPLLALATRPGLRGPLFAAIKAGYRASYRLRRARREA